MAESSTIEWTDATWNPITGCSVLSPGCQHCYAMKLAGTRMRHHHSREGLTIDTKAGPVWTGAVRFNAEWLDQPLRWRRPRMIFVCAHGDLFHEAVPDEWIDQVFAVMALAPQHTFQVLTKRAERMQAWFAERWQAAPAQRIQLGGDVIDLKGEARGADREDQVREACEPIMTRLGLNDPARDDLWTDAGSCKAMQWTWPLPNVWLGVSAEDQARADERIPHLLQTPAAVRWLSAEPLLGRMDLRSITVGGDGEMNALQPHRWEAEVERWRGSTDDWEEEFLDWFNLSAMPGPGPMHPRLDWIVAGGESGRGARPMHPDWARSLRDQCAAAGVPFFFKQWGEFVPFRITEEQWRRPLPQHQGELRVRTVPYGVEVMRRLGKKAAGRLLDGVQHDAMPEVG